MSKKGVIIANTGSPDSPNVEAVKEYLAVFLADSRIRPMKSRMWDALLKHFILPKRSPRSASKYAENPPLQNVGSASAAARVAL